MNKYVRALGVMSVGALKISWMKLFHLREFKASPVCMISPLSEITLDVGGKLQIGKMLKMRDGSKIRVRKDASCVLGNRVSLGSNTMIVCRNQVIIGDDVQFGPNVQLYDHDHDFRADGGIKAGKYKVAPITIGSNVWIGSNVVILRGTTIGDGAVIGAGTVLKGSVPSETVCYQKRENVLRKYRIS